MNLMNLVNFFVETATSVGDSDLQLLIDKVSNIVQIALNVIYIVLGLVLVIKGALLGVQIVKAADEPQVRQEKIGSLKWLVIGVIIGYGVAGVANIVLKVVQKNLTL